MSIIRKIWFSINLFRYKHNRYTPKQVTDLINMLSVTSIENIYMAHSILPVHFNSIYEEIDFLSEVLSTELKVRLASRIWLEHDISVSKWASPNGVPVDDIYIYYQRWLSLITKLIYMYNNAGNSDIEISNRKILGPYIIKLGSRMTTLLNILHSGV